MTTASPTKLRSGDWGATANGSVRQGDEIEIRTKAGKTWTARVSKVVWQGSGKTIVATEQSNDRPQRSRPDRGSHRIVGWDGVVGSPSYYSSGAFDEYDN